MIFRLFLFLTILPGCIYSSDLDIDSSHPQQSRQQKNMHVEKVTDGENELFIVKLPQENLFLKVEKVTEKTWPLWCKYIQTQNSVNRVHPNKDGSIFFEEALRIYNSSVSANETLWIAYITNNESRDGIPDEIIHYQRDFIYKLAQNSGYNEFYEEKIKTASSQQIKRQYYSLAGRKDGPLEPIAAVPKIKEFVESIKMFMTVTTTNDATIHMGIASSAESVILRDKPKAISMLLHSTVSYVMKEDRKYMFTAPAEIMAGIFAKTFSDKGKEIIKPKTKTEFLLIKDTSEEMFDFCYKYRLFNMGVDFFCVNIEELAEITNDYYSSFEK